MPEMNKIIKLYNKGIKNWTKKISKQRYQEAKLVAANKVKACRKIILFDPGANENLKNISLIYGIFFRGLEDLTDLSEIVAKYEWYKENESVEKAWLLLQNCKERFESSSKIVMVPSEIKETIDSFLDTIEKDFLALFGPGLYVSPEILIKKSICSICKTDYRTCPHLPNHLYNGKICRIEPTEIGPGNCVVILPHPKDPRCRLWPWHQEKEGDGLKIHNIPLIISFKIDDFLD
jgi:hypothetical protein